jgi:DNA-binding MarR family transcriptional regulator
MPLESLTPYLLSLCGREARRRIAARVPLADFALLAALSAGGPASQRELGERLRKDPADMVRLLDAASARGIVRRDADPGDRRRRRVVITAAGEAELGAAMTAAREVEAELLSGLGESERHTLHELLSRLPR